MKYSYDTDVALLTGPGNRGAGGRYISFLSNIFVLDSAVTVSAVTVSAILLLRLVHHSLFYILFH